MEATSVGMPWTKPEACLDLAGKWLICISSEILRFCNCSAMISTWKADSG
jgi:hypothetical protein